MSYDRHSVPDDSWFSEEQLDHQRMLNMHGRFWQVLGIDNPHRESTYWWSREGRDYYYVWVNETHRCAECLILCDVSHLLDQMSTNQEGS